MSDLNANWTPEFGTIYTWFAMDKNGRIAVMVNNCWGDLPKSVLMIPNIESLLDDLNEYMWEESEKYSNYPDNKKGELTVDLYCQWLNKKAANNKVMAEKLRVDLLERKNFSEANLSANKGYFVYYAVEGNSEGEDYPVGYVGDTKMGDYFRYLVPTVYASVEDFPTQIRHGIAVSEVLDFTRDRVFDNDRINTYFTRNYQVR